MEQSHRHLVRMEDISKGFGMKMALDQACLDLREGEVLGLIGDNGAGKSTILKILAGVVRKDTGDIFIEGEKTDIRSPRVSRALGIEMVYQDLSLCGSMTVWENMYLGRYKLRSLGRSLLPLLDKRRMAREAIEILDTLGIRIRDINEPVKNLSGGEQQAVAISRCMLFAPKIVLLDEPTASMALWEKERIHNTILQLKSQGRSLIMVTHDLREIFNVADRIMVLKEGRTVWCGPASNLGPEDLAQMMFVGKA